MITKRFRWLLLLGTLGAALGLLRGQETLAILSLTVLAWLLVEWLVFQWHVIAIRGYIQAERSIGGNRKTRGTLWTDRPIDIDVRVTTKMPIPIPGIRVEDIIPQNLMVTDGTRDVRRAAQPESANSISISCHGAGSWQRRAIGRLPLSVRLAWVVLHSAIRSVSPDVPSSSDASSHRRAAVVAKTWQRGATAWNPSTFQGRHGV